MKRQRQQYGALAAGLCAIIAGCSGPDVTYGDNITLRAREPVMEASGGQGGAGGALLPHGNAGDFVQTPEVVPPHIIDVFSDAGPPGTDAAIEDASSELDAGSIVEPPDHGPFCPPVPPMLLEPTATGYGESSGCEEFVCLSNASFESLDMNGVGYAFEIYDPSAYGGCTGVIGDVIIHNYLGADLSALSCLEMISGSLVILNAPYLKSLRGLEHLEHVSRDVIIGGAVATSDLGMLADLHGLSGLGAVQGTFALRAPAMATLEGLEKLRVIGQNLEIYGAESLYDLTGLSVLRAIGRNLLITGATGMRGLGGADALELIGGTFHFDGSVAMLAFQQALPDVRCVGGAIEILGPNAALEQLDLFASLERVGGDIRVQGNEHLRSIAMLSNVEEVRGTIAIQGNGQLSQLDLSSLEALGGVMMVTDNPQLEECRLIELAAELDRTGSSQIHSNGRFGSISCSVLDPLP